MIERLSRRKGSATDLSLLEDSQLVHDPEQERSLLDLDPRTVLKILQDSTLYRIQHIPQQRLVAKASVEQLCDGELQAGMRDG